MSVAEGFGYPQTRYVPRKVTLFLASQTASLPSETDFSWSSVADGGLDVHIIPGDHTGILAGPDIPLLAEELNAVYYEHIKNIIK